MTMENKIGLLVGLGFVIAVGILFSNYLSVNNEPQPAALQVAGAAVRSSLGDANDADARAQLAVVVRVPNAIAPANPVATADELANRARQAAAPVLVKPPVDGPLVTNTTGDNRGPVTAFAIDAQRVIPVPPSRNQDLIDAAQRAGEPVVSPDGSQQVTPPAPVRRAGPKTVEAEEGDSLGDLAERAYGTNTRVTRDALIAANPSLQRNPNLIVVGRTYSVTPATTAADRSVATSASSPRSQAVGTPVALYTVRPGDTLWSIAANEVGTPRAVAAIKDLNRDVLHGEHLRLNMKLRLPKRKALAD